MTFLFRRKPDPFILDDIESKIIELDDLNDSPPPPPPYLDYNEHEDFNEESFRHFYDTVVQGMFIMAIGGLCTCFAFLSILYPLI
jgi:hypothetical protein